MLSLQDVNNNQTDKGSAQDESDSDIINIIQITDNNEDETFSRPQNYKLLKCLTKLTLSLRTLL